MNKEFKPNVSRIIVGNIFGYIVVLAICIGLFISTNMFINFFNTAEILEKNLFELNTIKFFIYSILTLIIISSIFSFLNLIGDALTTKYSLSENYLTRKTTFLNEIEEDVPIKQITNTEYSISWFWDKIFGTGSISIYTSGSHGADMYFYGINSVTEIYENIKSEVDSFRKDIIKQKKNKTYKNCKTKCNNSSITYNY